MGERESWLQVRASTEELKRWAALSDKWGIPLSAVVRKLLDTAAEGEGLQGARVMTNQEIVERFSPEPPPKIGKANLRLPRGTRAPGSKKVPGPKKTGRCPHGFLVTDGFTACKQCQEG